MINKGMAARCTAGILGGLLLVGVGATAFAADPDGTGDVDVNVEIAPVEGGALSLTVADTETTLIEDGSTATERVFTGALPAVTVTDTREDVPAGVFWYVTGQASDFVGDAAQPDIAAEQLGWAPADIVEGNGEVAAGDEVVPASADATQPGNNTGLASGEDLLFLSLDSAEAQAVQGSWTANAGLTLETPVDVAPGSYTSTLTLSLFEDEF